MMGKIFLNDILNENIERIYEETLAVVNAGKTVPLHINEQERQNGYMILSDEDLAEMMPLHHTDILINAHLPVFDSKTYPHEHTFYELIYVHRGSLHLSFSGNSCETPAFTEGDFVLIHPSVIHTIMLGSEDSRVINILMKADLLNRAFFHVILDNPLFANFIFPSSEKEKRGRGFLAFRQAGLNNPVLEGYLTNILQEYRENKPLNESALEINLAGLCLELARSRGQQSVPASETGKYGKPAVFCLSDVCAYLSEHLASAVLDETAAHFHYNPKYFSDMLKKTYGKSFSGLLLDLKMAAAAKLLRQTSLSVSEIIRQLGYKNTSHFYRLFEETYHMKPTEYRRMACPAQRAEAGHASSRPPAGSS